MPAGLARRWSWAGLAVEPPFVRGSIFFYLLGRSLGSVLAFPGILVVPDAHPAARFRVDENLVRGLRGAGACALPGAAVAVHAEEGDDDSYDHDRDDDPAGDGHDGLLMPG